MLTISKKSGVTLIELITVISLFSVLSIGLMSVYLIGMREMDKTEIENETMTVFKLIKRELTTTIKEAKNVQWGGSFPLVITLYNDSIIRYRNNTVDGSDVIQKDHNDGSWNNIVQTNFVEYTINSISVDTTRQTADITVELNGSYQDVNYSIKRAITHVHWRNQ
ncbi:MAG: type II secretion system protein [Candidatus Mcinerneyibacterium aminivorans]|uniref:Type II secretion system protein n=1 Tax=Candidatus Mcinerneyibacterium aminivorans TaxID=2703815 RepID=A0A5D0MHH0_9BACT|nr:MAG: type II secretion system protein [Candidatus Mcinerneyibacterium aminivorans]